jgi:hypothetical protein
LIRQAIADFMKVEAIEIPTQQTSYTVGGSYDDRQVKNQYTEVQLCRLLLYLLDRPELGMPILNESLLIFLEYACRRDSDLLKELQAVILSFGWLIRILFSGMRRIGSLVFVWRFLGDTYKCGNKIERKGKRETPA